MGIERQDKDRIEWIVLEGVDVEGKARSVRLLPEELKVLERSERDTGGCGHLQALNDGGELWDCQACNEAEVNQPDHGFF